MSQSAVVLPYLVVNHGPPGPIEVDRAWRTQDANGDELSVVPGDPIPAWDANRVFTLERTLTLSLEGMQAMVGADLAGAVDVVVFSATAGRLARQELFRRSLSDEDRQEIAVHVRPDSTRLAQDLELTTGVYVVRPVRAGGPLSPARPGSILWELTEQFRLEGGRARLAMYELPFSRSFPGDGIDMADFHVQLADEPDAPIEQGIAVYVNDERREFMEQLHRPRSEGARRFRESVVRRALIAAVQTDWFCEPLPERPDALLATVRRWTGAVWPGWTPEQVRAHVVSSFSLADAQVESWLHRMRPSIQQERAP